MHLNVRPKNSIRYSSLNLLYYQWLMIICIATDRLSRPQCLNLHPQITFRQQTWLIGLQFEWKRVSLYPLVPLLYLPHVDYSEVHTLGALAKILKCKCWISLSWNGLSQHSASPLCVIPLENFERNKLVHKSSALVNGGLRSVQAECILYISRVSWDVSPH